jgi:CHAD domain-containing protein
MSNETDVLAVRLSALHEDVSEIKTALGKLSDAITKLALVEQNQNMTAEALERAFKAIERIEYRLDALERAQPKHTSTSIWVDRGLVALACAGAMAIARGAGVL